MRSVMVTVRRMQSCIVFEMGNSDAIFPVESVHECDILQHDEVENILDDAVKIRGA